MNIEIIGYIWVAFLAALVIVAIGALLGFGISLTS